MRLEHDVIAKTFLIAALLVAAFLSAFTLTSTNTVSDMIIAFTLVAIAWKYLFYDD